MRCLELLDLRFHCTVFVTLVCGCLLLLLPCWFSHHQFLSHSPLRLLMCACTACTKLRTLSARDVDTCIQVIFMPSSVASLYTCPAYLSNYHLSLNQPASELMAGNEQAQSLASCSALVLAGLPVKPFLVTMPSHAHRSICTHRLN